MSDAIVQGSTRFALLRDALLRELAADSNHAGQAVVSDTHAARDVVLGGRFNIERALRQALSSVGLLVELT